MSSTPNDFVDLTDPAAAAVSLLSDDEGDATTVSEVPGTGAAMTMIGDPGAGEETRSNLVGAAGDAIAGIVEPSIGEAFQQQQKEEEEPEEAGVGSLEQGGGVTAEAAAHGTAGAAYASIPSRVQYVVLI